MPKQARAAVFILPRSIYSFLTESYLPLTLTLQQYVQPQISTVCNPCYHLAISSMFINELSQTFSIFITGLFVGSIGVDFSTSILPLDDKSKTTGLFGCTSDPILTNGMRHLEVSSPKRESQKELLWPSCYQPENEANTWGEKRKNMGLFSRELLSQLALDHALQQEFHLCGDYKFSYCLNHLNWGFYYLQLEASSLINYS